MAAKQSTAFTARETELLTIAFQCTKEKPVVGCAHTCPAIPPTNLPTQIDYELMAAKAGLKGAKSARDSFGPLYNKILSGQKMAAANGDAKEQSGEPSPKKKATPSKRKAGTSNFYLQGSLRERWLTYLQSTKARKRTTTRTPLRLRRRKLLRARQRARRSRSLTLRERTTRLLSSLRLSSRLAMTTDWRVISVGMIVGERW